MFCYLPRFCPSPRLSSHHFLSVAVRTKCTECTALIAANNSPGISQNVKLVSVECRRLIHTNSIHYLIADLANIHRLAFEEFSPFWLVLLVHNHCAYVL